MPDGLRQLQCDVLVIGSEGTGARAALEAQRRGAEVLIITKGSLARSGATLTADGEIDVDSRSALKLFGLAGSSEDSPEQFAADMVREGDYLSDQHLVSIHAEEAPSRIRELVEWGAKIEGFIHAPGHTYPRGMWIPGRKLALLLSRRLASAGIPVLENTMAVDLLTDEEGIQGVLAFHKPTGSLVILHSKAVILATGGAMRVFPLITAPEELTGDGIAMALRCGAAVQDMEFPMFLPYCFLRPRALKGVIFPYDVSALLDAHALNCHGERYMKRWAPQRLEKATRDINSVAAAMEVREGRGSATGGVYLSLSHLPRNLVDHSTEWFPGDLKGWKAAGFSIKDFFPEPAASAWEVFPACHFWNGGIKIDGDCATTVPGLFAAGEGTAGIHGANRLAGNALTMTQVWGARAGASAARFCETAGHKAVDKREVERTAQKVSRLKGAPRGPDVIEIRKEIQRISGELVGIVREKGSLERAKAAIASVRAALAVQSAAGGEPATFDREWVEAMENENLTDVLEAVILASIERQESRGAMYRVDFPNTDDDDWLCNLVLSRNAGHWHLEKRRVHELFLSLPRGRRPYGSKG